MTPGVHTVVGNIDWPAFTEQKMYILNESNNNPEVRHILDGILHFMDAIQDAAVADGLATVTEVFGVFK